MTFMHEENATLEMAMIEKGIIVAVANDTFKERCGVRFIEAWCLETTFFKNVKWLKKYGFDVRGVDRLDNTISFEIYWSI